MAATIPLSLLRYSSSCVLRVQASANRTSSAHLSRIRRRIPTPISPHTHHHHHYHHDARRVSWIRHITSSVDEEAAAREAAVTAEDGGQTIFDKIIAKEIPSSVVYEDDKALAFRDISPQAPVHVLVIPKSRDGLTHLGKAEARHEEILGHLLHVAKLVAEKEGILDGFRIVVNSGAKACQSVYHLHLHVLGGRQMKWPAG